MTREYLYELASGDVVYREHEAVVVEFKGKRRVLSTGSPNGGYSEHLTHVFNHKSGYGYCGHPQDAPCTYEEYITGLVESKLGLSLQTVTGMATIVSMQNVCIETLSCRDVYVTAIATASLEVNGGRAGDPAEYDEQLDPKKPGTINIMLHVNADLSPGCMARAIVTLTEAKTAAIQELLGSSLYSSGIATGSGSDTVIVTANAESPIYLTYAGKHSKLGEMIGLTVKAAVRKALGLHMNLTPESQHSVEKRTFRYGLTAEAYWKLYESVGGTRSKEEFLRAISAVDRNDAMVTLTSLYIHLMDQRSWELLSEEEASAAGATLLREMANICGIDHTVVLHPDVLTVKGPAEKLAAAFAGFMLVLGDRGAT